MKGSSKCSVILGADTCWCNDYNVTIEVKVKAVMILLLLAVIASVSVDETWQKNILCK